MRITDKIYNYVDKINNIWLKILFTIFFIIMLLGFNFIGVFILGACFLEIVNFIKPELNFIPFDDFKAGLDITVFCIIIKYLIK